MSASAASNTCRFAPGLRISRASISGGPPGCTSSRSTVSDTGRVAMTPSSSVIDCMGIGGPAASAAVPASFTTSWSRSRRNACTSSSASSCSVRLVDEPSGSASPRSAACSRQVSVAERSITGSAGSGGTLTGRPKKPPPKRAAITIATVDHPLRIMARASWRNRPAQQDSRGEGGNHPAGCSPAGRPCGLREETSHHRSAGRGDAGPVEVARRSMRPNMWPPTSSCCHVPA